MPIRKIAGSQLFDGYQLFDANKVLIIKDGKTEAILDKSDAGEDVELLSGIICPGFINTHCHLELSHLKNQIPQNCGMLDFILNVMAYRATAAEIILDAIDLAEKEMERNGIVAVGDICNNTNTIPQKLQNNLHYTNFIEISGFIPASAESRFTAGKKIKTAFHEIGLPANIVPHAPYSVSDSLFSLIEKEQEIITSIHYNESLAEKEFLQEGTGDFIKLYKTLGIDIAFWKGSKKVSFPLAKKGKHQKQILVHNVTSNFSEIQQQKEFFPDLYYCICPNANLYIGNGLPDVEMLNRSGVPICIGTDSLAGNTQLCIAAEIRLIQKHFPKIKLETILQWSTLNGAKALGIDKIYGSFEKGKSGKYAVLKIK